MKNYFKIFEIEEKIEVDLEKLEEKYLQFQRNFHPDKAGIDEIEKSILINEGYDILGDEILRAAHFLQLRGIDINNDEKAPKVDQATLLEIMEFQEKIAESQENQRQEIRDLLKKNRDECFEIVKEKISEENYELAAQNLIKVKYYTKSLKDLKKL